MAYYGNFENTEKYREKIFMILLFRDIYNFGFLPAPTSHLGHCLYMCAYG